MASNENSPRIREKLFAKHFPIVRRFGEMPDDALVVGADAKLSHWGCGQNLGLL
jgi:hypothetical protein